MVLFVSVFVILFACKKIACSLKNLGGYNVQNRQILVLLSNRFGVEYKLGRQSVLEIVYTVEIALQGFLLPV